MFHVVLNNVVLFNAIHCILWSISKSEFRKLKLYIIFSVYHFNVDGECKENGVNAKT